MMCHSHSCYLLTVLVSTHVFLIVVSYLLTNHGWHQEPSLSGVVDLCMYGSIHQGLNLGVYIYVHTGAFLVGIL